MDSETFALGYVYWNMFLNLLYICARDNIRMFACVVFVLDTIFNTSCDLVCVPY